MTSQDMSKKRHKRKTSKNRKYDDKTIEIPHLSYRVILRNAHHPDMPGPSCERIDGEHCIMWIMKKYTMPATVIHEAMHALQFISEARGIDLIREQEHGAYLIQYIVAEALSLRLEVI